MEHTITAPKGAGLRPWQRDLAGQLQGKADNRSINFYVDEEGNKGKSWFQKWFTDANSDSQMLQPGKKGDIAYALDESKRVFFFNVSRGNLKYLQYSVLEAFKDGVIFSTKYRSVVKRFGKKCMSSCSATKNQT